MITVDASYPLVISDLHHNLRPQIDLLSDAVTQAVIAADLIVTAGQIQVDATATNLRQFSATIVDPDSAWRLGQQLTPTTPGQPLTPYGSAVQVSFWTWSFTHPTRLQVPAGLFRISDAKVVGDQTIEVTGYDLSRTIQRAGLSAPYVVAAGTNYSDAIVALARDRLGGRITLGTIAATDETAPLMTFDAQSDPWEHITQMAQAIGCTAYFDALGAFNVAPVQDPGLAQVVWTYGDAVAGGMLVGAEIDRSDEDGANGVVMASESSTLGAPISATVWDTNPSSPTYYLGPYGQVPSFQSSPYIGSQSQAVAAGQKWLAENLGGTEEVSMSTVVNPAHEPYDAVQIIRPRAGINDVYMLQSFTLPFDVSQPMQASTRKRRSISKLPTS